jgi:UDP-N-acetylglucosamine 2-epimerase (hydrolysing)
MKKKIIFITGSRADYGKIKKVIKTLSLSKLFNVHIFVTGMHLLKIYGLTKNIILKENSKFAKIFLSKNQSYEESLDLILANTIKSFSRYLKKNSPDMIIVHGDRAETLAAVIASSFNNYLTCHIEGGEITGTIDEHIRHSVTKLSHLHFVSNTLAKKNLLRMGENPKNVFIVGSPEVDLMKSKNLPSLTEVKKRYAINFNKFCILIFHPVTSNLVNLKKEIQIIISAIKKTKKNYVIISPNNDPGSNIIIKHYKKLKNNKKIKNFESMRFEYFLTLLKNSELILGNSSSGVREAPVYGIPSINIGNRQNQRVKNLNTNVVHIETITEKILIKKINFLAGKKFTRKKIFGDGNSSNKILNILKKDNIWKVSIQKTFHND